MKSICVQKAFFIKKVNRLPTGQKLFANPISDKNLISRIFKELNNKKTKIF